MCSSLSEGEWARPKYTQSNRIPLPGPGTRALPRRDQARRAGQRPPQCRAGRLLCRTLPRLSRPQRGPADPALPAAPTRPRRAPRPLGPRPGPRPGPAAPARPCPAASSGKMAARDRRARLGSEAAAERGAAGRERGRSGPPAAALTCQRRRRRRRPAADRRSPGARRPRATRGRAVRRGGSRARPARTGGGGPSGAG